MEDNKTWWAFVRTDVGAFMKVEVDAPNAWQATQMFKSMYGNQLISESAGYDPMHPRNRSRD